MVLLLQELVVVEVLVKIVIPEEPVVQGVVEMEILTVLV
tara:strand:+ start:335 stop:451 length:117 start_codon:yes stop_codon:yes gene_type:complete